MTDDRTRRLTAVRAAIENARREIRGNGFAVSREILRPFYRDCDDLVGTPEWAELSLTMAESFSGDNKAEAETYFNEALERIGSITDTPLQLLLRVQEHYGIFLFSVAKRPISARPRFVEAKKLAVSNGLREDSARVQLRLLLIDLEADKDPQFGNFKSLRRIAKEDGFTSQETLMAWNLHLGLLDDKKQGLRYARN